MASQALSIVISGILLDWLVRVMTGGATNAPVIRITLALKYPVRLETDVVNRHAFEQRKLLGSAMTGSTKILGQFIAAQPPRVEDQFCAGPSGLARCNVLSAGTVTAFTSNARHQLFQLKLISADPAGRVT